MIECREERFCLITQKHGIFKSLFHANLCDLMLEKEVRSFKTDVRSYSLNIVLCNYSVIRKRNKFYGNKKSVTDMIQSTRYYTY